MAFKRLTGMRDIFGAEALRFQKMETLAREVFGLFGFGEIRTPILEEKELFTHALGQDTDVVGKEMYEFLDRSKTPVAMRPEGTAGVVRAYLENNFHKNESVSKLFYIGQMFRSERPQAGRFRQFHQIGVEILGTDSPQADAEAIQALCVFLDRADVTGYKIKMNNLGTFEERRYFKENLEKYFRPKREMLCEDCRRRLERNVFRIFDCKVESCRKIILSSPPIFESLPEGPGASNNHYRKVLETLKSLEIDYRGDPYMVRGLDYYTKTVFEFTHPKLGAQDAVAAGGRYDGLVESFGGPSIGAVGFAIGLERLLMCVDDVPDADGFKPSVFIVALGEEAAAKGFEWLSALRAAGIEGSMDFSAKSMKSQMRSADKSKARFAVILGENELKAEKFLLKDMQGGAQEEVSSKSAVEFIKGKLSKC